MKKILKISDIETKEILFFDSELKERCFEFCEKRGIEFLPSLDNSEEIYIRDDIDKFKVESISKERQIDGFQRVFSSQVLNAFKKNHLLFVYTERELSGVVHFSDFNKPIVSTYLFEMFFQYEKALRVFLQRCRLNDYDLIVFLKNESSNKRRIAEYERSKDKADKLPPFQLFYINDLINFANTKDISLDVRVKELRNMIMHAHELVNMQNRSADNFIFDFETFEKFFNYAITLHQDYKKLKNRINFLQGNDESTNFY
jgi:hypothetical protein